MFYDNITIECYKTSTIDCLNSDRFLIVQELGHQEEIK